MDDLKHLARMFTTVIGTGTIVDSKEIKYAPRDSAFYGTTRDIERARDIANAVLDGRLLTTEHKPHKPSLEVGRISQFDYHGH